MCIAQVFRFSGTLNGTHIGENYSNRDAVKCARQVYEIRLGTFQMDALKGAGRGRLLFLGIFCDVLRRYVSQHLRKV